MSWASLDDGFHEDPRTLKAGLAAVGLYACATCYVARHLLDGFIPDEAMDPLANRAESGSPLDDLLRVGLIEKIEGGYKLVRYFEGNEPREKVEKKRADAKERKERFQRKREAGRKKREEPDGQPDW
jgi:hypothetical protein